MSLRETNNQVRGVGDKMNSISKLFDFKRIGYVAAVFAVLLSTVLPSLAFAAQITERSIQLSNSSVSATNVTYKINFKAAAAAATAGAFVVDFCSNSPVIGQTCSAPGGFSAAGAASATVGFTDVEKTATKLVITGTIEAEDEVSVDVTGIVNPSAAAPLYARIVTFDTDAHADAYTSTVPGAGKIDEGGVAMSITPTVGVSGAVLESLTFCVAKNAISLNCNLAGNEAPTLKLGETVGDSVALIPTALSTGTLNTQISTNALSGAVVRLKSSATGCGGLLRAGAPSACDIAPALTGDIAIGEPKFGVKTATATDTIGYDDAIGAFQPVTGSGYNNSTYALNYIGTNATGVTSTFGDPFLDTDNAPANNKNMQLTFGASVSNSTPAGMYSTDLSLIASGKF